MSSVGINMIIYLIINLPRVLLYLIMVFKQVKNGRLFYVKPNNSRHLDSWKIAFFGNLLNSGSRRNVVTRWHIRVINLTLNLWEYVWNKNNLRNLGTYKERKNTRLILIYRKSELFKWLISNRNENKMTR